MDRRLSHTENYQWSSRDNIGKGAYGEVFKCRHRKTGDVAAVKLFKGYNHTEETEIEILRRLDHPNIIKVLAVETVMDDRLTRKAMIMEYCSGKSLNHFLEEPENCYGMDDKHFLLLLGDINNALRYLQSPGDEEGKRIVHRDIKPLNILIGFTDRGQPIFKLSDFGTAKVITHTQEECGTLVGTPEYLQPDMFQHYTHQPHYMRGYFDARAVDLWPLGTSLYYAACGSLPFKPFGSLNDSAVRQVMCDMIVNKKNGIISGIQHTAQGHIEYSDRLPFTCRLSRHLQSMVVPLLAKLLVSKADTEFDHFKMVDEIVGRKFVRYFIPHAVVLDCVYISGELTKESLWKEISVLHSKDEIQPSEFNIWWKGFPVNKERTLSQIDSVLELEPVMIVGKSHLNSSEFFFELPFVANYGASSIPDRVDPNDDKKFARRIAGNITRMLSIAEYLRDIQLQMNKHARYLDAFSESRVDTVHKPTANLTQITTRVATMFNSLKGIRDALPGNSGLQSMHELFEKIEQMCVQANGIKRDSDHLHDKQSLQVWTDDDLCSEACVEKLKTHANSAAEVLEDFKNVLADAKESPQGWNQRGIREWSNMHKLDKLRLRKMHEIAIEHIRNECIPRTKRLSQRLNVWSKEIYEKWNRLDDLANDLEKLSELQETLQESTEKFGVELSDYIRTRVRHTSKSTRDKSEIFERARQALEESSRTLEDFHQRLSPHQSLDSFAVYRLPRAGASK